MKNTETATIKSINYPPGGILIWFLMLLEIFTFLGAIMFFLAYKRELPDEFLSSKKMLNPLIGTINTIILITSGYFMAISVDYLRNNNHHKSSKTMLIGTLLGIVFLMLKGVEFYQKITLGIDFNYNTFYTFYWLMTGFHFVHVLFGVGLLGYMYFAVKNKQYTATSMFDVETSATYWHLCDLIWILIFPIIYLL
ncbi:MAG: cytochrome c oxidase subunit 3 [Vicingaceae bacterium]